MSNNNNVLTVRELTRYIKLQLESDKLLQQVWVQGEISNFTHHSSGHMYFTLKDQHSRIKSIMFATHNRRLPFIPREGTKVIASGSISVYDRDGQYQFYITEMQPDGIGGLFLAYEQLKKKLDEEGLFLPSRKRPIPKYPHTIGVITSPTGAAVRDIITTAQRRYPSVHILVYPVVVQGKQAGASIAQAIAEMNRLRSADVLIVGRGGGSLEELWAFNEEIVARSIAASHIPVISAVGHETDFTIADFVADLRAPTPTAAAELAVPHQHELRQHIIHCTQRIHQSLIQRVERRRERLARLSKSPAFTQPHKHLLAQAERLDRLKEQLAQRLKGRLYRLSERRMKLERELVAHNPKQHLLLARRKLEHSKHAMLRSMQSMLNQHKLQFQSQVRQMDALSPLKVMQRGYSLVYDEKQRTIIKTMDQVQLGDMINVKLNDGRLTCHVWSMEREDTAHGRERA